MSNLQFEAPPTRGDACPGLAAAPAAWFLVGHIGPTDVSGEMVHVSINTSPFTIGRKPDSNLCLPLRTVSSCHAELRAAGGDLILRDLTSTNGTFVNGQRLSHEIRLAQDDLVQFAEVALRVRKQVTANASVTLQEDVYDQALALVQFDKLMHDKAIIPYYQPIVDLRTSVAVGFEVLGRSRLYGVENPGAMFRAAAKLNLEVQLSTMMRWEGVMQSCAFQQLPHLFVNTHPAELRVSGLEDALRAIRAARPEQPITLEIHEAAITDVHRLRALNDTLTELNIDLAYDDFGSGQARLVELIEVRPTYLKFDLHLIRNIDKATPRHQQMISTLVRMTRDLDVATLAEGVETETEAQACRDLGFEFAQGYFFGKPAPAAPA